MGGLAQYWDLCTAAALVYTAIVTPYEVAFLAPPSPSEKWSDSVFIINRCVDVIFIIDMFVQFRTAYKRVDIVHGSKWITDPKAIAIHYVRSSWFYLDLFSILTSLFDILGGEDTDSLTVLRVVRVLRLAKLVRLMRGSRIFKKWEMSFAINYKYLSLFQIVFTICIGCHWFACIWGLEASFDPLNSWPIQKGYCTAWESDDRSFVEAAVEACGKGRTCEAGSCSGQVCEGGYQCAEPFHMYSWALYWSVATTTSVGYGDVVAVPFNIPEQFVCSISMMLGGGLWGYMIGIFANLASASEAETSFAEELSSFNTILAEINCPQSQQFKLREYLFHKKDLDESEKQKELLLNFSPAMQLEVSFKLNARWVHMVWYLSNPSSVPDLLVVDLAMRLKRKVFPPPELFPPGFMYIAEHGCAYRGGRMLRKGSVWGEDIVLQNSGLHLELPAISVRYSSVFVIDATELLETIDKYAEFKERFRIVRIKWMIRRAFVREAEIRVFTSGRGVFRNRFRPIYAKKIAAQMDEEWRQRNRGVVGHAIPGHVPGKDPIKRQLRSVLYASVDAGMDLRAHQMRTEDERYDIHNTAARFQALESKLSHLEGLMLQKVREKRASATPAALTVALPASSSRSRSPTPWHSKDSLDA